MNLRTRTATWTESHQQQSAENLSLVTWRDNGGAPKTQVLASVMKAVLPAERRARLESPGDPVLLATLAAKKGWKRLTLYISTSRQS